MGSVVRGHVMVQWGEHTSEDRVAIDARGVLQIQDGTSNTVLISEGTGSTANCSADPAGGSPLLEALTLRMQNPRSKASEFVIVRIVHTAEVEPRTHIFEVSIDDRTFTGLMEVRSPGQLASGPFDRRDER